MHNIKIVWNDCEMWMKANSPTGFQNVNSTRVVPLE